MFVKTTDLIDFTAAACDCSYTNVTKTMLEIMHTRIHLCEGAGMAQILEIRMKKYRYRY